MIDSTIDPNETRDKAWNWAPQLAAGETIASAVVSIVDKNGAPAANASVSDQTHTDSVVIARLTAATGANVYALCRVTTSTGQILDDTWALRVESH